jgi:AraC-like DNA-binding protein
LDRLLVTLDVDVQSFALCQVQRGLRLIGDPVDAIMVHFVLVGTHVLTVPGHDPVICSEGAIVLIPPGYQPRVAADEEAAIDVPVSDRTTLIREGLLLMDVTEGGQGDLRFISGIVQASLCGSFGLFDNLTHPIAQHVGDYEIVQRAFALMVEEVGEPSLGARALTSALMKACLVLMIRQTIASADHGMSIFGPLSDKRLCQSVGAVLDRPGDAHTVGTLAEIAGMSRSSFCRNFSEAFEMSPAAFVIKARLHHAAQMLRSTPLSVKAIAGNVGFASRSHFSRAFSEAYGSGPADYRLRHQSRPADAPSALNPQHMDFPI